MDCILWRLATRPGPVLRSLYRKMSIGVCEIAGLSWACLGGSDAIFEDISHMAGKTGRMAEYGGLVAMVGL